MRFEIEDPDDHRLRAYHQLRERGQRSDPEWVVAESETAVRRLLQSGWPVQSVLVTPGRADRVKTWLPADCPLFVAERAMLRRITGHDLHRGCAAAAPRPALDSLPALPPQGPLRLVIAEHLADPVNVGALIRNCRAFGVDLLILDDRGADPLTPRAVRASMGHVFDQPLVVRRDLAQALTELEEMDLQVLAATPHPDALELSGVVPHQRSVLLLGNEGSGLSQGLLERADVRVRIPTAPDVDSLNVAAASAVLLYALGR